MVMASYCETSIKRTIPLDRSVQIFDAWFLLSECRWYANNPYHLSVELPWGVDDVWIGGAGSAWLGNPDDPDDYLIIEFVEGSVCDYVKIRIERCRPEPLAFADVEISRRYGNRLYLAGKLKNIVASDEICIKYFRPEDGTVHNLPSATRDYTYLKDVSGTYTFPDEACIPIWDDKFVSGHWEGNDYVTAHYEDTYLPGLYYLIVYDVSGTCEAVGEERCRAAVLVIEPRYQYQVEFKTANLDSPEAVTRLEARRRQWARVTDKRVEPWGTDCFSVRLKYSSGWDNVTGLVWLCSAYQARTMAKFMPLPPIGNLEFTEYLEYFRAECDCVEFRTSRKYGVPCVHIMAAYYHLNRKPPYCEYIKCP